MIGLRKGRMKRKHKLPVIPTTTSSGGEPAAFDRDLSLGCIRQRKKGWMRLALADCRHYWGGCVGFNVGQILSTPD